VRLIHFVPLTLKPSKAYVFDIETEREEKTMITKAETTAVLLRLPVDMDEWLKQQAARTLASRHNEILRSIRLRMDTEQRKKAAG
jgi:hypothetical protein